LQTEEKEMVILLFRLQFSHYNKMFQSSSIFSSNEKKLKANPFSHLFFIDNTRMSLYMFLCFEYDRERE